MSEKKDGASVEISDELRDRILLLYDDNKEEIEWLAEQIAIGIPAGKRESKEHKYLAYPITDDEVDFFRYNFIEGCIDEARVIISTDTVACHGWLPEGVAAVPRYVSINVPLPYTDRKGEQDGQTGSSKEEAQD